MTSIDSYRVALDRTLKSRARLVLALTDDYTGKPPIGGIRFVLKGSALQAQPHRGGFYCFLSLPQKNVNVRILSDDYFTSKTGKIELPRPDEEEPVAVRLIPTPAYPFPSGTTLIRGRVLDAGGRPVAKAAVEALPRAEQTETTAKGEFVLYFTGLRDDDIVAVNHTSVLKGDPGTTIQIRATHHGQIGTAFLDTVVIGKTTAMASPIVL